MSTNFAADGAQLDQELAELRQRLTVLEQATGGDGSGSASGGGATPTQWHDVTDYGATADGSDDTTAIQAAVDRAEANGGEVVYFPAGYYWIDGAIEGGEGVSFRGDGAYSAIIYQTDPNEHGIDLKGAGNLVIEDIGITHNHGLAEQESGQCLFSGAAVQNVTVQDCAFFGSARQGVGFWSSGNRNIRFVRNDLRDCARAGVVLFGEGIFVGRNYLNGTGDDAIATNTDATTHCLIVGNIVINGAGVGEATGGGIKFHGRNTIVAWNVVIDPNQYGIRGQVVDSASGKQTDISPTRNIISNNTIHHLTDINPQTQTRAAIEMRQFQNVCIWDNSINDIPGFIGILLRNDDQDTTIAKLDGNFVNRAERAIQVEDRHEFIDIADTTAYDVDRVLQVRDPVESLQFHSNSGHEIAESCVRFGGVDSGRYSLRFNEFTGADTNNIVSGSISGGEVINQLNTPSGETSSIRNNAAYDVIRWSEL